MRSDLHDVEVIFIHATERAVCIRAQEGGREVWIPKSQCEIATDAGGEPRRGRIATLTAPEGVLLEKGLI
jgi:hypothetical protein